MEITGCNYYDSCDIRTDFAEFFNEGIKKLVKTIVEAPIKMQKLIQNTVSTDLGNRECSFGHQCTTGKCNLITGKCENKSENEECENGNQCGDGLSCINKICRAAKKGFGGYCYRNDGCVSGKCATNNKCTGTGKYANGQGAWCDQSHQCTNGYCHPWPINICA